MVDYTRFREIERTILEDQNVGPFEKFGFKADLRLETPSELANLMVGKNYTENSELFFKELVKVINGKSKTRHVAVVGPQGIGKTTLAQDFTNSVQIAKEKKNSTTINKVKLVLFNPLKYFKTDDDLEIFNVIFGEQKIENFILVLDDIQTILYPPQDKRRSPTKSFDRLQKSLERFNSSLIISTWTSFGWNYALTVFPELTKYFDEIIYINGLDDDSLRQMLDKRFNLFSDGKIKLLDIFSEEQLSKIFQNSSRNPRLCIELISQCIELASEKKQGKIDDHILEKILVDAGIEKLLSVEDKDLAYDKVLRCMLSHKKLSINHILIFVPLDRSSVQKRLEEFIKLGIVLRELKGKEYYYFITPILRAKIEQSIMEECMRSTHQTI